MLQVWILALRDLAFERVNFLCNVCVIAGIIMPLLVLSGVKGGIYEALLEDLESDPRLLRIITTGEQAFDATDAATIGAWPGVAFVALRTRAIADEAKVRVVDGGRIRAVTMVASGPGDPLLSEGTPIDTGHVALSERAAQQINAVVGGRIELIATSRSRSVPLIVPLTVSTVVTAERLPGNVLLAPSALMDEVEAFYEGYAIPARGLLEGRDLSTRIVQYEGVRLFVDRLEDVSAVDERLANEFGVNTVSKAEEIAGVLSLGRNLQLALNLITFSALIGLAAALLCNFYAATERKRTMFATLALLGQPQFLIAWIPVVQAFIICGCGLVGGWLAMRGVLYAFDAVFTAQIVGTEVQLTRIPVADGLMVALGMLVIVVVVSVLGARAALRSDPAIILRS